MLYLASVLLFLLGLAHSLVGERFLLIPLFREGNGSELSGGSSFAARTLRFAWHLTTVAWWALVALLLLLARDQLTRSSVLMVIGYAALLSGLLPLLLTRGRHLAWAVLFLIGGLALYAAY